jgi:DNA helicase MCM9
MVTTLSTRTSVLGVMNPPKGRYNPAVPLEEQLGIGGPLLSRFDVVLLLLDTRNAAWDNIVAAHVLSSHEQVHHPPRYSASCQHFLCPTVMPQHLLKRVVR